MVYLIALSCSVVAKTPPLASMRRPRSAIVGLYQSVSRLFICLNSWSKYFASSSKGFGVRNVVTMEAIPLKTLNTGAIALINDEAVSNVVASVPSFFRGLALLASLYFFSCLGNSTGPFS